MKIQVLKDGPVVEVEVANSFCPTGKGGGVDPSCGGEKGGAAAGSSGSNMAGDELVQKMTKSDQRGSEIADYASSKKGFTESHWEQVIKHPGFVSRDPKVKAKLVSKIDKLQSQYTPEARKAAAEKKKASSEKRKATKAATLARVKEIRARMAKKRK